MTNILPLSAANNNGVTTFILALFKAALLLTKHSLLPHCDIQLNHAAVYSHLLVKVKDIPLC